MNILIGLRAFQSNIKYQAVVYRWPLNDGIKQSTSFCVGDKESLDRFLDLNSNQVNWRCIDLSFLGDKAYFLNSKELRFMIEYAVLEQDKNTVVSECMQALYESTKCPELYYLALKDTVQATEVVSIAPARFRQAYANEPSSLLRCENLSTWPFPRRLLRFARVFRRGMHIGNFDSMGQLLPAKRQKDIA